MVRRFLFLFALIFFFSISAKAQGSMDLFGGYSFEHLRTSPSRNLNGVEITGQYKLH